MTQYIISVKDDSKAKNLLALLSDLAYIDISKRDMQTEYQTVIADRRLPSEIITPLRVESFKIFSREELNER